jgi:lactoylglutathione lyase
LKLAATVIYVDDVPPVLEFYRRAFGLEASFVDLDVQLPGRSPGGRYQFASLDVEGGTLQFGTHDLGTLLMPSYGPAANGRPAGVEIAFYSEDVDAAHSRALAAGALSVAAPKMMPWGQTASYVQSIEGTFVAICSPNPEPRR